MENTTITVPTMLTIKEASKTFKLSEWFLRKGVNEGRIVAIKSGRKILINAEKLVEYMNTNTFDPPPEPENEYLKPIPVKLPVEKPVVEKKQRRGLDRSAYLKPIPKR